MKKILTFAVFLMLISCNQINNDCKDNKCSLDNNVENTKIVKQELMNVNKDMIKKDYSIYTAIWCPHCRAQYKHLQEIYDKYKELGGNSRIAKSRTFIDDIYLLFNLD